MGVILEEIGEILDSIELIFQNLEGMTPMGGFTIVRNFLRFIP